MARRRDPFVAQLAEICRAERSRAKWVFVPTHADGLTLGDRLAREGCDWANLRFVTPFDIAVRMAAPFLIERGLTPSDESLGPALIMSLLLGLPELGGYIRPMAEHTSMADALWRAVRELRGAGVRAADLPASAFASAAKHAELVALVSVYERHLDTAHIADTANVFREALAHMEWCPIAADDCVTEAPHTIWPPVVGRFLGALGGRRVPSRTLDLPGADRPPRLAVSAMSSEAIPVQATSDASRLRFLRAPDSAGRPLDDMSLDVFHAGGHDDVFFRACHCSTCFVAARVVRRSAA